MGILTEQKSFAGLEKVVAEEQQLQLENPAAVSPASLTKEESKCLEELRKLITEDEEMREIGVDEDEVFLLAFVRGKRCDAEKAFKTLKNYIQIRKVKYPQFFQNLTPRKWKYLVDGSCGPRFAAMLKHTDNEGRKVGIARCSLFNPNVHKGDDVVEAFVTAGLELLRTEEAPRNGLVLVIDASGFGFKHAREISMARIYMILQIFLSAYPVKYKGFHILNNNFLFDTILSIVKQCIPKKLRDRIHLHGSNYASLHKHIPREVLPECFGGLLPGEEAYDLNLEKRLLDKIEYYEKTAKNW